MTIDELWEKYQSDDEIDSMTKINFLAAMTEYGEHIKAQAMKVCENEWANTQYPRGANWCAAAIAKMEIT